MWRLQVRCRVDDVEASENTNDVLSRRPVLKKFWFRMLGVVLQVLEWTRALTHLSLRRYCSHEYPSIRNNVVTNAINFGP